MATVEATHLPQHLTALAKANAIRSDGAAVKREVKAGTITISEALDDPRAGSLTILGVLTARNGCGRERSVKLLASMAADPANRLSETMRVRELTARQRRVLARACS